jgi:hypothetical protein
MINSMSQRKHVFKDVIVSFLCESEEGSSDDTSEDEGQRFKSIN